MATAPTQSQLSRLFIHQAIHQLETKEVDTGTIFGSQLDLLNEKLAYSIKKFNVELAYDNVHCLEIWMGARLWIETVFNEERSLNKHCLRLIEGAVTEKSNRDRDLELSDYRRLDDFEILKLWNRLHPQNSKTYPRHTWLNNPGDVDAAGQPVILNPP